MTTKKSKKPVVGQKQPQGGRQGTKLSWFTRHLRQPIPRQEKDNTSCLDTKPWEEPIQRQFAPSSGTVRKSVELTTYLEPPPVPPSSVPPSHLPRPGSGVVHHVNAWLDASTIKPGLPLMAGVSYWREGDFTSSTPSSSSSNVRYAMPIVHTPNDQRPSTSHSQNIKSFCRRAKKMQVRMPSLLRTKSQRATVMQRKEINRRSNSMPQMSPPVETAPAPILRSLGRSVSLLNIRDRFIFSTTTSAQNRRPFRADQSKLSSYSSRLGSLETVRLSDQELRVDKRVNAVFRQTSRSGDRIRPSTGVKHMSREDSMGNLSDAPTYFSGPPPPPYRSRAASILTTSSFGCVDGMNAERRQISQQRVAQGRGVKGKFKKFAQKAHFPK